MKHRKLQDLAPWTGVDKVLPYQLIPSNTLETGFIPGEMGPAGTAPVPRPNLCRPRTMAQFAFQPCGMSRPVPGLPSFTIVLGTYLSGFYLKVLRTPTGMGVKGPLMNTVGPLPRRSLRPALRARSFYREHAQLFRWIYIGLFCTGELGTKPYPEITASSASCLWTGSFT